MSVRLLAIARRELFRAAAWHERDYPGRGDHFLDEVGKTLRQIGEHPGAAAAIDGSFRRALVRRFPYGVIYTPDGSDVLAIAIAHCKRRPGYWRRRI